MEVPLSTTSFSVLPVPGALKPPAHTASLLPSLVIAGGPKCGTTSLFDWLQAHPEIEGSSIKETYYFMDAHNPMMRVRPYHPLADVRDNYHADGMGPYQQFFSHCDPEARITMEATPHYLYQQTPPQVFSQRTPQPHIVFALREPAERILSHFKFTQDNLLRIHQKVSFETFVSALLENKFETLKSSIFDEQAYFWLENQLKYSRYYEHIQRWLTYFPEDKITILLFEEMIVDPKAAIQQIANKIGIDAAFYDDFDFTVSNQTVAMKYPALRRLFRANKRAIKALLPAVSLGKLKSSIKARLLTSQQAMPVTPSNTHTESLSRLREYFEAHNRQLETELGLNLDSWRKRD